MVISVENLKFFPSRCILHPDEGFPLELGIGATDQKKTRMTGLPGQERSLTISSAVWIQYTNVTDGRTDGQMNRQTYTGDSKDLALTHSVGR